MRFSNRTHHGFTVIELLAVLVISSMLVTVLLSISGTLSYSISSSTRNMPYDGAAFAFAKQLQSEYACSRDIQPGKHKLVIDGYFKSSESGIRHSPTRIIYETRSVGTSTWLIRRELDLLETAPRNETVDVVCQTFSHFEYFSKPTVSRSPAQFRLAVFKLPTAGAPTADKSMWFETVLVRHGGKY